MAFVNLAKSIKCLARVAPRGSSTRKIVRCFAGVADCATDEGPPCSQKNLVKKTCTKKLTKKPEKPDDKPEESPFKNLWENPDCCVQKCPDIVARFDDLYYIRSDKAKRVYTQTWADCPKSQIRPKKICCLDKIIGPDYEKRPRGVCPKTACPHGKGHCGLGQDYRCPKFQMPGCRGARKPPLCLVVRKKTDCKKVKAPYPAFSECKKPKPMPRHPVECQCMQVASMCDVWSLLRRKLLYGF